MAEQDGAPDDPADLSPEDRAIVRRGLRLLEGLRDKPKVSRELQERSESVDMPLEALEALAAKETPPEG
jgi:hypothetical protein